MSIILSRGEAVDVDVDHRGLERAANLVSVAVDRGHCSAASLLVARRDKVILSRGFGTMRPESGAPTVTPNAVFLLASITKPVTACALLQLVDRGLLSLEDPVQAHLPEFSGWDREKVRVRHLLSHVSGMPDMLPHNIALRRSHAPLSAFVRGAMHTPLLYEPGSDFSYQSKGILLAAEIVERVSGQPLRDYEAENIFVPLGMARSALGMGRLSVEDTVWCSTSMVESEDEQRFGANSAYWRDMGHPWGGMHSSTTDLAILLRTVLNGGVYGDVRVFSAAASAAMRSDQNSHLPAPWGLGWALSNSRVWNFFGELVSAHTFGHVGATGTVAWSDPQSELICVALTNQMVEGGSLLRRISNAVAASVIV